MLFFRPLVFRTVEIIIPDTLTDTIDILLVQLMSQDTINLPMTVVFPWPSKENFKLEFLSHGCNSTEMQQRAIENLAQETLEQGRSVIAALMETNMRIIICVNNPINIIILAKGLLQISLTLLPGRNFLIPGKMVISKKEEKDK